MICNIIKNRRLLNNINFFKNKSNINITNNQSPKEIYNMMYSIIDINELNDHVINNSTIEHINKITDLFEVKSIINKSPKTNCISLTFFCQNNKNSYPNEFPNINFKNTNTDWYKKYVIKLLKFIDDFNISKYYSSYKIRIYLENQLEYFIPIFISKNVEIYHMKNNSIGCSPGTLWRFLVFNDTDIDISFSFDIDESFESYINFIDFFTLSNKTLGRYFPNYNNIKLDLNNDIVYYSVVLAGFIGIRPKNVDIDFKSICVNYIIYRMLRSKSIYPNLEKDSDLQNIYNKSTEKYIYGIGGHWYMYGFDEKIWKHVLFSYFVEKGDVVSWSTINKYDIDSHHPCSIDYNYCKYYNNSFE